MSKTQGASLTFLRDDPRVEWINYAGFEESPYHPLVRKYLGGRACSLMTFGVKGGFEGGARFYDALKLVKRVVNLGDSNRSHVTRPRQPIGR